MMTVIPVGVVLSIMGVLIISALVLIFFIMKRREKYYREFQERMREGDKCCFVKHEKYKEGRINKLYEYNAMVETEKGDLEMVGKIDLYPIK